MRRIGVIDLVPLGEGRAFDVDGERIAVFRTRNGEVFATQAECPHRGGPLADGIVGGSTVVCPLHARKFELSTGACRTDDCEGLVTYPIVIRDGVLFLIDEHAPAQLSLAT
jgi:nitrite reductase (NADH) small subunit